MFFGFGSEPSGDDMVGLFIRHGSGGGVSEEKEGVAKEGVAKR